MVFLSILSGIAALDHVLTHQNCPPCAGAPPQATAGTRLAGIRSIMPVLPVHNGVYHGLIRR
jgi:hypothetical protein